MVCVPSEDSYQPGQLPSLIRVFAVRMKKARVLSYPVSAQWRLWSDWADAQADLSLRWAHIPFCWFCHEAAQVVLVDLSGMFFLLFWVASFEKTEIRLKSRNTKLIAMIMFFSSISWGGWSFKPLLFTLFVGSLFHDKEITVYYAWYCMSRC